MDDTVILFLALLAVLCQLFVISIAAIRGAAIWSDRARSSFVSIADTIGPVSLIFAFAVALVTMLGSLYLSEIKHYAPCTLCWYQRICIYPMTILLLVALIRREKHIWPYVLTLCAIVTPISIYHYLIEWFPEWETSVCTFNVPCTAVYVRKFHYLSIPLMALTSALTVAVLMLLVRRVLVLRAQQHLDTPAKSAGHQISRTGVTSQ